jgi:hypothetical protein
LSSGSSSVERARESHEDAAVADDDRHQAVDAKVAANGNSLMVTDADEADSDRDQAWHALERLALDMRKRSPKRNGLLHANLTASLGGVAVDAAALAADGGMAEAPEDAATTFNWQAPRVPAATPERGPDEGTRRADQAWTLPAVAAAAEMPATEASAASLVEEAPAAAMGPVEAPWAPMPAEEAAPVEAPAADVATAAVPEAEAPPVAVPPAAAVTLAGAVAAEAAAVDAPPAEAAPAPTQAAKAKPAKVPPAWAVSLAALAAAEPALETAPVEDSVAAEEAEAAPLETEPVETLAAAEAPAPAAASTEAPAAPTGWRIGESRTNPVPPDTNELLPPWAPAYVGAAIVPVLAPAPPAAPAPPTPAAAPPAPTPARRAEAEISEAAEPDEAEAPDPVGAWLLGAGVAILIVTSAIVVYLLFLHR